MRLYRGDPVLTRDGSGYVVYGDWPNDTSDVKVRLVQGNEIRTYPKTELICLPEYRKSNPKIDIYEDGRYVASTQHHRTIARYKAWLVLGKTDPKRYTYKIDKRKR